MIEHHELEDMRREGKVSCVSKHLLQSVLPLTMRIGLRHIPCIHAHYLLMCFTCTHSNVHVCTHVDEPQDVLSVMDNLHD